MGLAASMAQIRSKAAPMAPFARKGLAVGLGLGRCHGRHAPRQVLLRSPWLGADLDLDLAVEPAGGPVRPALAMTPWGFSSPT